MSEIVIRVLSAEDGSAYRTCRLNALLESPKSFGADHETRFKKPLEYFKERASSKEDNFIIGAFDGDLLVGTVGFAAQKSIKLKHRGSIWGVYVEPNYRSQGLARKLMTEVLNRIRNLSKIKQVELGVGQKNEGALALYKSFGFEIFADEKRAMFVDGEYIDEYLMVLMLDV